MRMIHKIGIAAFAALLAFFAMGMTVNAQDSKTYSLENRGAEYCLSEENQEVLIGSISEISAYLSDKQDVCLSGKDVTLTSALTLPACNLALTGRFLFDAPLHIPEKANVLFDGATVALTQNGVVHIKGGFVKVKDSDFYAAKEAFRLDYAASSNLLIQSGSIKSDTTPILSTHGTVTICGGSIESNGENALFSYATVILSGTPDFSSEGADLKLSDAPILSYDGVYFDGSLSMQLMKTYLLGDFEIAAYKAKSGVEKKITCFDANGAEIPLTYATKAQNSDETEILAVSLPYTLRVYADGQLLEEKKLFSISETNITVVPQKTGFSFLGWVEKDTGEPLSSNLKRNVDVTAVYKLDPPVFAISSIDCTYDGAGHDLTFSALSHPLADDGVFSFVWTKDGVVLPSSSQTLKITNVVQGGSYVCAITFTYQKESVTVKTPPVTVKVSPKSVKIPSSENFRFDGETHKAVVPPSADYRIVSNTSQTDVGQYPFTVGLLDDENTVWEDGKAENKTLYFEIGKAENLWLISITAEISFVGKTPNIKASPLFGEVCFYYAEEFSSDFTKDVPIKAGTYQAKAIVAASENYTGLESEIISFTIVPLTVVGLRLGSSLSETEYQAFETFQTGDVTVEATFADMSVQAVEKDDFTVLYSDGDCFHFGDTYVTICYQDACVIVPVTVKKAIYNMAETVFCDQEKCFNGQWQSMKIENMDVVGKDGYPLFASYVGGGIHAGTYEIIAHFYSESPNYEIPKSIMANLTITPYSVAVEWNAQSLAYNGYVQYPGAKCRGLLGEELSFTLSGGGKAVGAYTATLTLESGDYIPKNPTYPYRIEKAVFDLSSIVWQGGGEVYDGFEKGVCVANLPKGLSVAGYVNAVAIEAGVYHASVSFSYDADNYEYVGPISFDWEIKKATYDISTVSFDTAPVVFDTNPHTPTLIGEMPRGVDGYPLRYSFDVALTHVQNGAAITVSFETDSHNYMVPSPLTLYFSVLPLPICVNWGDTNFVYDGTKQIPSATGCVEISVSGVGIYAGTYTAIATSLDADYVVENDRVEYKILPAKNAWLIPFAVDNMYEDGKIVFCGTAKKGEMTVSYYKDAACQVPASSFLAGTYYAVASVVGLANYEPLYSEVVSFEVFSVVPIRLSVTLLCDGLFGGEKICESDVSVFLTYNSGRSEELTLSQVNIIYENKEYLTVPDKTVFFQYGDLTCSLPITVRKSVVAIPVFTAVYDGTVPRFSLTGEEPYEMEEYNLGADVFAYPLTVTLKDPENYCFDGIDSTTVATTFSVTPRPITLKISDTLRYRDGLYADSSYEIVSGTLAAGDVLSLIYSYGETASATVSHQNYQITVIDGQIQKTRELSPEGKKECTIFISIGTFLACVFGFLFLLQRENAKKAKGSRATQAYLYLQESCQKASAPAGISALPSVAKGRLPHVWQEEKMKEILASVDKEHADALISDTFAKHLLHKKKESIVTFGKRKCIVNLDTVNHNFENGSRVDINSLKAKGVIPYDCGYIKILARGSIGKQLYVYADDFSLQAVKMIALTGGIATRVSTVSKKFSASE